MKHSSVQLIKLQRPNIIVNKLDLSTTARKKKLTRICERAIIVSADFNLIGIVSPPQIYFSEMTLGSTRTRYPKDSKNETCSPAGQALNPYY